MILIKNLTSTLKASHICLAKALLLVETYFKKGYILAISFFYIIPKFTKLYV